MMRTSSLGSGQIEARSLEIVSKLLPGFDRSQPEWPLLQRMVHATGDPSVAHLLRIHPRAVEAGVRALRSGCAIITDVGMVSAGISHSIAASLGCEIVCAIAEPAVIRLAQEQGITRSAAAMRYLSARLAGSIVAIGNAPTALLAVLDALDAGFAVPALIVGTPVGFVGAAEAKAELATRAEPTVPYITLEGTRGGSAIAVAAVNALLRLAAKGGAS